MNYKLLHIPFLTINYKIIPPSTPKSPLEFLNKILHPFFSSPTHPTFSAHVIVLDFIILTVSDEYRLYSTVCRHTQKLQGQLSNCKTGTAVECLSMTYKHCPSIFQLLEVQYTRINKSRTYI